MERLKISLLVSLFPLLAFASRAGEKPAAARGETFQFVFGKEPLVYSVHQKVETKTYLYGPPSYSTGAPYANSRPSSATKTIADVRYKFRLTGLGAGKGGITAVRYEPFDHEANFDATGAAGHFLTTIHGLSVKSTQNGIVIADTDKEIGIAQAKAFKSDAIPVLLSGLFDMNDLGQIKAIHGDLPFIDVWQQMGKTQIGLFGFQFPGHAVTNGETWQVIVPMKGVGSIKFDGETLNHTNCFSLVEDAADNDPSIATFKLSAPMRCRDLSASMEERGQNTHADLSDFDIRAFGMIHFDKKRHVFVDGDINKTASISMTTLVQGRAVSASTEVDTETEINLLPESGETPTGEAKPQKPVTRKTL